MPSKPKRLCQSPGCAAIIKSGETYCDNHRREVVRQADAKRLSASQRGYDHRWQKARDVFIRQHPLCEECKRNGHIETAAVVDHIIPHKGNRELFWDPANWQSLCVRCHGKKTMNEGAFKEKVVDGRGS